jgi:hypothetical protein
MFSPPDSLEAQEWFRRFDAALRRLPAEECTRQHEEMQQHLEELVTAQKALGQTHAQAWKSALVQFGDPTHIGRKMYQEWRQGRTGFRADMTAILFGIGLQALREFVTRLMFLFRGTEIYISSSHIYTHERGVIYLPILVYLCLTYGASILIHVAIGRKYPFQAIKGAFYADILWSLWVWIYLAVVASVQHSDHPFQSYWAMFAHSMLWVPLWIVGYVAISYLASVTKRGWYRPSLADFKLTLPHKRLQINR